MPLVSVCMPVYNAERYVAEAVESILGQTFGDFEFLIIDDGSTDGSRRILESFAARDPRIRLVSRPNTGYVVALNEMLGMARGELIARMDADDVAMPGRFERQAAYLREHPEVVAVGTSLVIIDPHGAPLAEKHLPEAHETIEKILFETDLAICHPSAMIRRDALLQLGGYKPEYCPAEDIDLWLRLAEVGRLANVPEVLIRYRQHMQSMGNSQRARQEKGAWLAVAHARQRRGLADEGTAAAVSRARPNPSEVDQMCKWAWWALASGHIRTARAYALRCSYRRPFSVNSWRVLYCALRGR